MVEKMNKKIECHFCNRTITGGNYGLVEDKVELELYIACHNCFQKLIEKKINSIYGLE